MSNKKYYTLLDMIEALSEPETTVDGLNLSSVRRDAQQLEPYDEYMKRRGLLELLTNVKLDERRMDDMNYIFSRVRTSVVRKSFADYENLEQAEKAMNDLLDGTELSVRITDASEMPHVLSFMDGCAEKKYKLNRKLDETSFERAKRYGAVMVEVLDKGEPVRDGEFHYKILSSFKVRFKKSRDGYVLTTRNETTSFMVMGLDSIVTELILFGAVRSYLNKAKDDWCVYESVVKHMLTWYYRTESGVLRLPVNISNVKLNRVLEFLEVRHEYVAEGLCGGRHQFHPLFSVFHLSEERELSLQAIFECRTKTTYKGGKVLHRPSLTYSPGDSLFMASVLRLALADTIRAVSTYNYLESSDSHYAASYEEKRNIPKRHRNAMETCKLASVFSDVELDSVVDLDKFGNVEKDYLKLITMFGLEDLSSHKFKFRRLGKHKAAGLYFPSFRTLCIDIDGTKSFAHELLHLLDYYEDVNNPISERSHFYKLASRYEALVTKAVDALPDDDAVKKRFYGSTKYNRDYYFRKTEIFARCGELYLTQSLGIDNSGVEDVDSVFYPKDRDLLLRINAVFGSLIKHSGLEVAS